MSKPRRFFRDVDGILLLDKAFGVSSNAALQQVRELYGAKKAGHAGSLDPLATGLLPVCFGQATKVCGRLLNAGKRYRVGVVINDYRPARGLRQPRPDVPVGQLEIRNIKNAPRCRIGMRSIIRLNVTGMPTPSVAEQTDTQIMR